MPTDAGLPEGQNRSAPPIVAVELVVVCLVAVGLIGLTVAVYLFIQNGRKEQKIAQDDLLPKAPPVIVSTRSKPVEPDLPPLVEQVQEHPDTSLAELAELEAQLKIAREARAKADLMAWVAENAARMMEIGSQKLSVKSEMLSESKKKYQQFKDQIEQRAMSVADEIARLELDQESAEAKYEAAKNRKGYSILPYRGPNGTWHRPVPIECSRDVAQIMPAGPSFRLIDLELSGVSRTSIFSRIIELAMRRAASQATPDGNAPTVYVLFVVKPSGIKAYYEARARLQAQGVAFGYELVDENTLIDYPDLGDLTEWPGYQPPPDAIAANDSITPPILEPKPGLTAGQPSSSGLTAGLSSSSAGNSESGFGGRQMGEVQNGNQSTGTGSNTEDGLLGGVQNGNRTTGTGSNVEDGLFVWKNGLGGVRGPGGLNTETGPKSSGPSAQPSAAAGSMRSSGFGDLTDEPSIANNATGSGSQTGFPKVGGTHSQGVSSSPRVDKGAGTFSQLGRSSHGGSSAMGNQSVKPNLNPPWGKSPDSRRFDAGTSSGISNSDGSGGGTFEDLVAELQAQGRDGMGSLESRPGAVPIMPGDLLENDNTSNSQGVGRSASPSQRQMPALASNAPPNSASPFARNVPGLPRFEPVTTDSSGIEKPSGSLNNAAQSGQEEQSPPSRSMSGSNTNPSGSNPFGSNTSANQSNQTSGARSPGGSSAGSQSSESPDSAQDQNPGGFRSAIRRFFNAEDQLPEKSWEVGLYTDADGITIRPGEHRLNLRDMNSDPDLLPRILLAMFEKQLREHPERYWRPYIRYRVGPGGESMVSFSQSQLAEGLVRWPAILEDAQAKRSAK